APRLSVPLSPVPVTRPSAPTAVISSSAGQPQRNVPRTGESPAPRTLASPTLPPATRASIPAEGRKPNPLPWIGAAVLLLALPGIYFGLQLRNRSTAAAQQNGKLQKGILLLQQR